VIIKHLAPIPLANFAGGYYVAEAVHNSRTLNAAGEWQSGFSKPHLLPTHAEAERFARESPAAMAGEIARLRAEVEELKKERETR